MTALGVWRTTYVDTEGNSNMQEGLYTPANQPERRPMWSEDPSPGLGMTPQGRWRAYDYEELVHRDKASLDIFWLKDESLSDSDKLPAPEVIAAEIVEDLEAALEQFREILGDMVPAVAGGDA